jgi:EAL domain-containing protein (putative c-di-GMP-specific phosphodiesterase class I)
VDYFYGHKLSKEVFKTIKCIEKPEDTYLFSPNKYVLVGNFPKELEIQTNSRDQYLSERLENLKKEFELSFKKDNTVNIVWTSAANGIKQEAQTLKGLVQIADYSISIAKQRNVSILVADENIRSHKKDQDDFTLAFDSKFEVDEFTPFFQPIMSFDGKQVIGCESLVRWQKESYRIITADKFKAIALEKNYFDIIDKAVIVKSFSAYKSWRQSNLIKSDFLLAINMSYHTLKTIDIEDIVFLANVYDINTYAIEFDFDDIFYDEEIIYEKLKQLKSSGFRIAIDAFGFDKLSIKSFMHFDVDTIKIDKKWLLPENTTERHIEMYKSIIQLANNLRAKTLIKGIETGNHLNFAMNLNFDYLQGYYFTRPINKTNFEILLRKFDSNDYYDEIDLMNIETISRVDIETVS